MNSEAQIILSFLFKRSGKEQLKESEIYLPISLDLGWFTTKEAKDFIIYALQQKLLTKKDDLLTPSFDVEKITVPVGFYPKEKSFSIEEVEFEKEVQKDVVDSLVQRIVEKTGKKSEDIFEDIKIAQIEKNILLEVAILLVAKKYNVDVNEYFDNIEKTIFREN